MYKILIIDPLLEEKARLRIRVNMKLDEVQQAIRNLFSQGGEPAEP
jgi:hypothetical protein